MKKNTETIRNWLLVTFIILFLAVSILYIIQLTQKGQPPSQTEIDQEEDLESVAEEAVLPTQIVATPLPEPQTPTPIFQPIVFETGEIAAEYKEMGVIIFSMTDGLYHHLFVYHPQFFPLSRLTNNAWDDIHPALSADGTLLAYSSKQDGYWDIFLLDLKTYQHTQITQTAAYEGSPSWSPDSRWIVYESNRNGNLDLYIQSIEDMNMPPIQLTTNSEADYSPRWSPDGRQIMFSSLQNGNEEIWIADLDQVDDRFTNLLVRPAVIDGEADWSPDGSAIVFSSKENQNSNLLILPLSSDPSSSAKIFAAGDIGIWNPQSTQLLSILHTENTSSLAIINVENQLPIVPFQQMPGRINGATWGNNNLDTLLPLLDQNQSALAPAEWEVQLDHPIKIAARRFGLSQLTDVTAPFPYLHDDIDESFSTLRLNTARKIGWDFLATLENAFLPITNPSSPDILENWLYSGRAFELSTVPAANQWMVTIREDISGKTYWRIYLRTLDQSGAVGMPLRQRIWSFEQRTQGSPAAYEQGGNYSQDIPDGYWVDFTDLAAQYGWRRLPALLNWRTYYPGTQHTVYVQQDALDLMGALLELYPPEALLPPATNSVMPIRPTATPEPEE